MKNITFFIILICSVFVIGIYGCERTELQKSSNNNGLITPREITDCSQCPNEDDCCCGIELKDIVSGHASLRLCGTTDGGNACTATPPASCSFISGGGQSTTLNSSNPKLGFCMIKGNALMIQNLSSTDTAKIYISCQYDLTHPQTLQVNIPPNSFYYAGTNNSCEIAECQ